MRVQAVAARYLILIPAYVWPAFSQSLTLDKLDLRHVAVESATYQGRGAIRIVGADPAGRDDVNQMAIIRETSFEDGTIEVMLAGDTAPDAPPSLRGFVGVAFRVTPDGSQFECIYLRPKNGRSEDQAQRNHSTQYISFPGFDWQKLRTESPGKYESYVDLAPGQWTHVRIRVAGSSARLYVNEAAEPVLVVNDLKQKPIRGAVALWVGPGTIAHFADLKLMR